MKMKWMCGCPVTKEEERGMLDRAITADDYVELIIDLDTMLCVECQKEYDEEMDRQLEEHLANIDRKQAAERQEKLAELCDDEDIPF